MSKDMTHREAFSDERVGRVDAFMKLERVAHGGEA